MILSGWTRLWIATSVIWWVFGAFILVPQFPSTNAFGEYMLDLCRSPQRDAPFANCDLMEGMLADYFQQAWWDLAPSLVLWIAGPLVTWVGVSWITKGFATEPAKNFPTKSR